MSDVPPPKIVAVVVKYDNGTERTFKSERSLWRHLFLARYGEKKAVEQLDKELRQEQRRDKGLREARTAHRVGGQRTAKRVIDGMARLARKGVPERERRALVAEEIGITPQRVGQILNKTKAR